MRSLKTNTAGKQVAAQRDRATAETKPIMLASEADRHGVAFVDDRGKQRVMTTAQLVREREVLLDALKIAYTCLIDDETQNDPVLVLIRDALQMAAGSKP